METVTLVLQVEAANAALAASLTDLLQRQLEYSLDDTVADSDAVRPGSPWAAGFLLVTVFPPDMAVHFAQTLHAWLVRYPSARLIVVLDVGRWRVEGCRARAHEATTRGPEFQVTFVLGLTAVGAARLTAYPRRSSHLRRLHLAHQRASFRRRIRCNPPSESVMGQICLLTRRFRMSLA